MLQARAKVKDWDGVKNLLQKKVTICPVYCLVSQTKAHSLHERAGFGTQEVFRNRLRAFRGDRSQVLRIDAGALFVMLAHFTHTLRCLVSETADRPP